VSPMTKEGKEMDSRRCEWPTADMSVGNLKFVDRFRDAPVATVRPTVHGPRMAR
jgi:hypothetical protein